MKLFKNLMSSTTGIAAVELGLVLGLITMAILGTVQGLGAGVQSSYNDTATKVAQATP